MKKTIKALLIVALVSLLAILIVGCEEEKKDTSSDIKQAYSTAGDADKTDETEAKSAKAAQAENIDIKLYFSDDQAEFLVPETRQVANVEDVAKTAIEELIKGPKESGNHATIPSETRVLGVDITSNVTYVNFSKELVDKHWGGSAGELLTIASIVNTLTEFENIQKVQILVDGKVVDTITGHADVSKPLARNETMIKK